MSWMYNKYGNMHGATLKIVLILTLLHVHKTHPTTQTLSTCWRKSLTWSWPLGGWNMSGMC